MPLSDLQIRKATPGDKPQKLTDEKGLYLLLQPTGGKLWRFDYRHEGKRKTLALGTYPDVSLAKAREMLTEARKLLANGIDPSEQRKTEKHARKVAASNAFEVVAREWFAKFMVGKSESHRERTLNRLETDIFPWLGKRPVSEIKPQELLICLRRIEERGAIETAHRVRWSCSKVFRFAIAAGMAENDPADLVKEALTRPTPKAFPTITDPMKIADLMRALDALDASFVVRCAARLAPLLFVRPGELRKAEWLEIDLDKAIWLIPAEKMKMRKPHIVPLSQQALEILRELQPLTGNGKYVFPGARTALRPMSEAAVNVALRRLGYEKDEFTGHSFRKIASTLLNEATAKQVDPITGEHIDVRRFHADVIEIQLAHSDLRFWYNPPHGFTHRTRQTKPGSSPLGQGPGSG
ncbi:MAG: integrase arm-type DNA-binding domain-containing protein [Formivibrio sp.]|nr:integrase arm-type DNA-binding domain-containing protein [Formivibrio sp.]